jgi:hypothetical protein
LTGHAEDEATDFDDVATAAPEDAAAGPRDDDRDE